MAGWDATDGVDGLSCMSSSTLPNVLSSPPCNDSTDFTTQEGNGDPENAEASPDSLYVCRYFGWEDLHWHHLEHEALQNDPKALLHDALVRLNEGEWKDHVEAMQAIQILTKHHPGLVKEAIVEICTGVVRHIDSLRSGVARNALLTANHFSKALPKEVAAVSAILIPALTKQCASEKNFLSRTAQSALDLMTTAESANVVTALALGEVANSTLDRRDVTGALWCTRYMELVMSGMDFTIEGDDLKVLLPTIGRLLDAGSSGIRQAAQRIVEGLLSRAREVEVASKRAAARPSLSLSTSSSSKADEREPTTPFMKIVNGIEDNRTQRNLKRAIELVEAKRRKSVKGAKPSLREMLREKRKLASKNAVGLSCDDVVIAVISGDDGGSDSDSVLKAPVKRGESCSALLTIGK